VGSDPKLDNQSPVEYGISLHEPFPAHFVREFRLYFGIILYGTRLALFIFLYSSIMVLVKILPPVKPGSVLVSCPVKEC